MKKSTLISVSTFLLFITISLTAQDGIYSVFPERSYTILQFVDAQNGWAGNLDCLLHTSDGGSSWEVQLNFEGSASGTGELQDYQIRSANFINPSIGFLNVYDTEYQHYTFKTTDGGKHWTKYKIVGSGISNGDIDNMDFIDSQIGFAKYNFKNIIKTIDGGKNWTIIYTNASLRNPHFSSEMVGYLFEGSTKCLTTKDGGNTWSPINIESSYFQVLHSKGGKTWIGTAEGLYISGDVDGSWLKVSETMTFGNWSKLQMVNKQEGFYYSDGSNTALCFLTKNGGKDWEEVFNGANIISFVDLNTGWIAKNVLGSPVLYKVSNQATEFSTLTPDELRGVQVISNNEVLVIGKNGLIIRSADSGKTWSIIRDLYGKALIDVCFANSNNGLIIGTHTPDDLGTRGFVAKSTNNGQKWEVIKDFIADNPEYQQFVNDETAWIRTLTFVGQTYRFNTYSKMYISNNFGNTWTDTTLTGVPFGRRKMRFADNTLGFMNDNNGLYKTDDGGITWTKIQDKIASDFSLISPDNGWFASASGYPMFRMSDRGNTWTETNMNAYCVYFMNSTFGIYSGNSTSGTNADGTYYTKDGGQTWNKFSKNVVESYVTANYNIDFADKERGWIVSGGKLFTTISYSNIIDGGGSEPQPITLLEQKFDSVDEVKDWTVISNNSEYTWVLGNIDNLNFNQIDPTSVSSAICPYVAADQDEYIVSPVFGLGEGDASLEFYAGYNSQWLTNAKLQIMLVTNNGQDWNELWEFDVTTNGWEWKKFEIDLTPYANNTNIQLAWEYIGNDGDYVALDNVKVTGFESITDVQDTNTDIVPNNFELSQNYPNPFNPSTQINYSLPESGNVRLIIYDILGREVKTIVNEFQNAGSYSIDFNAGELSNGIYFYRLNAGGFSTTKKMILLK